jgi:tRNA1(Val) A37 N6-methylase TrmN6
MAPQGSDGDAPEDQSAADQVADDQVTYDSLLRGRIRLVQPARGFRSSLDPVLLAGFLAPPYGRFLDIGCGTGALSFLLLALDPGASGVAVESQPRLARLAARGAAANGFGGRLEVRGEDARHTPLPPAAFDLVATNPPFRPVGQGPLPPDPERAAAHHEVTLALEDWVAIAAGALGPGGRLGVVFPASRAEELAAVCRARGLAPTRRRLVIPRAGEPPGRVLLEARHGPPRPHDEEAPLVVHGEEGYTAEVRRMLGEG